MHYITLQIKPRENNIAFALVVKEQSDFYGLIYETSKTDGDSRLFCGL
ncbi:MAG: hypothetical protein R3Y27_00890 [Clostridia bacterium]